MRVYRFKGSIQERKKKLKRLIPEKKKSNLMDGRYIFLKVEFNIHK